MGSSFKANLSLVHSETGQRYPMTAPVLIGRLRGEILFPTDEKLSPSHCQILITMNGYTIHDTGSQTGTYLNGELLRPNEPYPLHAGAMIAIGDQVLRVLEPSYARSGKRKRRKSLRKKSAFFDPATLFMLFVLCGGGYFLADRMLFSKSTKRAQRPVKIVSPFQMAERELKVLQENYRALSRARKQNRLTDAQLRDQLKKDIMPTVWRLRAKMDVVKGGGEWEREKIRLNRQLLAALHVQVTAVIAFVDKPAQQTAQKVQLTTEQVAAATRALETLERGRKPANFDY